MKLSYKTRGDSSPQGKPRVYFTGHPKDLKPYFDEIADDILKIQNCAIYYDAEFDASYDNDELEYELGQMQLFVIPVTSRFLFQKNRALDVEVPFAISKHIPILPLLQESNLEEEFNQKCGNLQMLDKHDKDNTSIPFEAKLEKFLNSVLVKDELAKKVRAAFDAYVFLSYRKKDRKYAQELMRLIHKNELCRDIAIWYDEFLTPGENFNDAIEAALKKSSIFALVVTPNIVEQENYVMTIEYPEACKLKKNILPAKLVPTDNDTLYARFQGLPACTDAHDDSALSSALLEALKKIAIRENDAFPEHNFFIGLAYLNGIDVEVDHERALSLIKSAAEAELPEAMEKLVSMYQNGDGIKQDHLEAIHWQECLIECLKKQFERSKKEADGIDLIDALWTLGNQKSDLGKLTEARDTYHEMYDISKLLVDRFDSIDAKIRLSNSYDVLGNICAKEGKLVDAKKYYEKALEIISYLYEEDDNDILSRNLVVNYGKLGRISRQLGRLSEAKEFHLKALEENKKRSEKMTSVQIKSDIAFNHNELGRINEAQGDLIEAQDHYLKALEIYNEIIQERSTIDTKRDLAIAYDNLGFICKVNGQLDEAMEYHKQALELHKLLYEETQSIQAMRDLAISYQYLGMIYEAQDQLEQAKAHYLKELEMNRAIYQETPTVETKRDLYVDLCHLGDVAKKELQSNEAKKYYQQALEITLELYEKTDLAVAARDVCACYSKLLRLSHNPLKMRGYLMKMKDIYEELSKKTEEANDHDLLAGVYYSISMLSAGKTKKKLLYQAYEIWKRLCQEDPDDPVFAENLAMVEEALEKTGKTGGKF